jgi:predicted signal transduction protein with EAL and GGDEF domain
VRVTLSIGAAFLEGGTATVDTMMTTADTALYEVKQSGRDGFRAITVGALDGAMRDKPLPAEWFDQLTLVEMGKRK